MPPVADINDFEQAARENWPLLNSLLATLDRLTLALMAHVDHCPNAAAIPVTLSFRAQDPLPSTAAVELSVASAPHTAPGVATALFDPTAANTGSHPDVIAAQLAVNPGPRDEAWYVVTIGKEPGVYQHNEEMTHNVFGVPMGAGKRHDTQDEALDAYKRAWALGAVRRVSKPV